ncbi:Fe-S cluster assembly ATPase SufC [Candidatus Uhrbacteria bacterium]|nr:Fe-S cluster assembly ATPase SufC [Candidatus Uhrbacteria bacterium]
MKPQTKQSLQVKHVSIAIGDVVVVRDVSLTIKPGETHILMGPNGSGKSTLLNGLAGNPKYTITSGRMVLNGKSIAKKSPTERAHAGLFLAFQHPVDIPGVRVATLLRQAVQSQTGIRFAKQKFGGFSVPAFTDTLRTIGKSLNMDERFAARMLNVGFSGGERKKSEVLQMAVLQPAYALLDEIDSGLDVDALRNVASLIQTVQRQTKAGLLIVTHNPQLLEYISPTHVHVMVAGRVVASGKKELASEIHAQGFERYISKKLKKNESKKSKK